MLTPRRATIALEYQGTDTMTTQNRTFQDFGIDAPMGHGAGNYLTICPKCSPSRKKKRAKTLSCQQVAPYFWNCHHCGWSGSLESGEKGDSNPSWWIDRNAPREYTKPSPRPRVESDPAAIARKEWHERMKARGLGDHALTKENNLSINLIYFPQTESEIWALSYPYYLDGELINYKHRAIDPETGEKVFRMEKDAERILWRLDKLADDRLDEIIICEGENDALACEAAGFLNATSVPNGAPKEGTKDLEGHLSYLENKRTAEILEKKRSFVLACDVDGPGRTLRDELARRLGAERCRVVEWPDGCKDANDVLMTHGSDVLRKIINDAPSVPIAGTMAVRDFVESMDQIWLRGLPQGPTTGWESIDRQPNGTPLYRPEYGLVTTVTGVPGSGKSRWVNALFVNLAMLHDTRFAICSPEYKPTELLVMHLAETFIGKSAMIDAPDRMTFDEWTRAMRFVDEHFFFITPRTTTVAEITEKAKGLIRRYGCRGFLIDPFTEIDLDENVAEVKAIKGAVAEIQRFAWDYDLHAWINAHPTKMQQDSDSESRVVGVYDIAGAAHFANKSDFIISLWRDKSDQSNMVDVHIKKSRFAHLGNYGKATLRFDPRSGRYHDTTSRVVVEGTQYVEEVF